LNSKLAEGRERLVASYQRFRRKVRRFADVIRTSPPLNISKADVDEAIRIMDESLAAIAPALAGAGARR